MVVELEVATLEVVVLGAVTLEAATQTVREMQEVNMSRR